MAGDGAVMAGLAAASFGAGVMNAVAGGGTLLTFPALFAVVGPTAANVTSTVALLPGSLAGAWGFRRELAAARPFALRLLPPSVAGGVLGSLLLVAYPEDFAPLVPWLILSAATLFLLQKPLARLGRKSRPDPDAEPQPPRGARLLGLVGFQLLVATYGGYFGAGIGILMLASLGFMGVGNIHRMNGVKTFLASSINLVTVAVFLANDAVRGTGRAGLIHWEYAGLMAVASVAGGYLGARVSRRLPPRLVRAVVVVIGFGLTAYYFSR